MDKPREEKKVKKYKLKQPVKSFLEAVAIITFIVAFIAVGMVGMINSAKNYDKKMIEQKKTEMSVTQISQN